jgi:hypothetical protein
MATVALPIRELSANVQYEAASTQKAFWEVVESKRRQFYFDLMVRYMTRRLDRRMGRLLVSQEALIEHLREVPTDSISHEDFSKVANDLDRIVAMTTALVDDSYDVPHPFLEIWRPKLEKISDLNGYLDSFAESFRIASDETCTALLADMVRKVAVDDAVSV